MVIQEAGLPLERKKKRRSGGKTRREIARFFFVVKISRSRKKAQKLVKRFHRSLADLHMAHGGVGQGAQKVKAQKSELAKSAESGDLRAGLTQRVARFIENGDNRVAKGLTGLIRFKDRTWLSVEHASMHAS